MKRVVPITRAIIIAFIIVCSSFISFSQSITMGKVEVGVGLGPLVFLGDLGGARGVGQTFIKDIDYPLVKLNKGVFINIAPTEWIGFRLSLNQGVLEGDDKQAPNKGGDEVSRLIRNLNFKSNLLEGYIATEIYPTVLFEQYDGLMGKIRPYGVIGIGMYHFDPQTRDVDGSWVRLQPLHTEGQGFAEYPTRKAYKLTQMEIPMGFGFKFYVKENMYVGIEVLHRKLFTDYVDDVSTNYIDPILFDKYLSPADAAKANRLFYRRDELNQYQNTRPALDEQRGDPKQNDAFFSTLLRMGWRLATENSGTTRQLRCPKFY